MEKYLQMDENEMKGSSYIYNSYVNKCDCSIFQIYSYSRISMAFKPGLFKGLCNNKAEDFASTLWRNVYLGRSTEQTTCARNPGIQQLLGGTVVNIENCWKE